MHRRIILVLALIAMKGYAADLPGTGLVHFSSGDRAVYLQGEVDIKISGIIAHVQLSQTFVNQTDQWQHATYSFPLNETAAVDDMEMRIGERLIRAQIREKTVARTLYRQAVSQGQKAALIEQQRPNLFQQSIANIPPGEQITVKLSYMQRVDYRLGDFHFRFPMTVTPGSGSQLSKRLPLQEATNRISIRILIDPGMPIDGFESPYHDLQIAGTDHGHGFSIQETILTMDRDLILKWRPRTTGGPQVATFSETVQGQNYHLLMLVPPRTAFSQYVLPREMIFVLDTSGSMKGPSIEQAQESLLRALQRLPAHDYFNVIEFNSKPQVLFAESRPAGGEPVRIAEDWVAARIADGGTNMAAALWSSLTIPRRDDLLRHVIFITDGAVTDEQVLFQIIHQHLGDARLFTVGIGSAPNSYFMRKAAEFGRGTFTHVGDLHESAAVMNDLFVQLDNPLVSDITITWPGDAEVFPGRIPALYAGEPLIVMASGSNLSGPVSISGTTGLSPWWANQDIHDDSTHTGVGSLWARAKIDALEDEKTAGRDAASVRAEVTAVALNHNLVSPYTSLVAVEQIMARFPHENAGNTTVTNTPPVGLSLSYPGTATNAGLLLLVGFLSLLFGLMMLIPGCPRWGN